MADVPGLIEGASEGAGLGHEFLAHLERARLLVHVIDASEDDLEARFRAIDAELARVRGRTVRATAARRAQQARPAAEPAAFTLADERIVGVLPVSCATGAGIDELKRALFTLCPEAPPLDQPEAELPEFLEYQPRPVGPASGYFARRAASEWSVHVRKRPSSRRRCGPRAPSGAQVEIGDEVLEWE